VTPAGIARRLLAIALVCVACGVSSHEDGPGNGTPTPSPTPARNPNVVVIVADDLGWGDVSAFWAARVSTPRIDALAASGARLTDFYDTAPVCAPARASIYTGRWPSRTGVPWVVEPPYPLRESEITIGAALKERGYATANIGKWHLGPAPESMPIHFGFDVYFGLPEETAPSFIDGDQPTAGISYEQLSQVYLDRATAFVHANAARPFLLVLPARIPHAPYRPAAAFNGASGVSPYCDSVLELDWFVGKIVDLLKAEGIDRDTIVVFTSDNGPVDESEGGGSTGPFFGRKQFVNEGGIRVPAIVSWPGRIPAGRVISEPATTLDLFPTLLRAAGGTLRTDRPYDGEDILDLLTGAADHLAARDLVFWVRTSPLAVRSGRWKYVQYISGAQGLYDLSVDPAESNDLTAQHPDVAGRAAAVLADAAQRVKAGN
jgi:arylsulfatase A